MKNFTNYSLLLIGGLATLLLAGCSTSKPKETVMQPAAQEQPQDTMAMQNEGQAMTMHKVTSEEDFILDMTAHHQEAVDTSTIIIVKSGNKALKNFAQTIIDAQTKEITQFKNWFTTWYPNNTDTPEPSTMMGNLSNLVGDELDKAYITGMIKHHEGAIDMAKQVLDITQRPELVQVANAIITTQTAEIKTLNHLLEDVGQPEHEDKE